MDLKDTIPSWDIVKHSTRLSELFYDHLFITGSCCGLLRRVLALVAHPNLSMFLAVP